MTEAQQQHFICPTAEAKNFYSVKLFVSCFALRGGLFVFAVLVFSLVLCLQLVLILSGTLFDPGEHLEHTNPRVACMWCAVTFGRSKA